MIIKILRQGTRLTELQDAAHEIIIDPGSSLKERGDALIVKAGMKSKRFFGMGMRKDAIFE